MKPIMNYPCPDCNFKFLTKADLKMHSFNHIVKDKKK